MSKAYLIQCQKCHIKRSVNAFPRKIGMGGFKSVCVYCDAKAKKVEIKRERDYAETREYLDRRTVDQCFYNLVKNNLRLAQTK